MRPARDSETPFIRWNCCEAVSQNIPLAFSSEVMRASSTRVFMYGSSSGTFCILSEITGAWLFARNRRGSSRACFWTSRGSRETYLHPDSAILRKKVLLPTWRAPISNTTRKNELTAQRHLLYCVRQT